MNITFNNGVKLILTILLPLCLLNMPYGFYQLVRFVAFIGFSMIAFNENLNKDKTLTLTFLVLALLFQPFFKIALGRSLWNIIDVIIALFLIISIFIKPSNTNDTK
ncbi:DUF6804 family protein [Flavobacterium croceum]|uniref:DUF6804 family protein n=1 Tax=Flavobacterium croceum TaxID=370975 RepID=UPI0031F5C456